MTESDDQQRKARYLSLCRKREDLPIFFQPWWLDAVSGTKWKIKLAYNRAGSVTGILPYVPARKAFTNLILMPPLTPHLGVHHLMPDEKWGERAQQRFRREVTSTLLGSLEPHTYIRMHLLPAVDDVIPFLRAGYRQSINYTVILDNLQDKQNLFDRFQPSLRRKIRRASEILTVSEVHNAVEFYERTRQNFRDRGRSIPYSKSLFCTLDQALKQRNRRTIYLATHPQNGPVAGLYIVRDTKRVYYLASWLNRRTAPQGAVALLVWRAIQDLDDTTECFDFEGSMIPGVASFFLSFGGRLVPYHVVTHFRNNWVARAYEVRKRLR